jgi:hypothetical protein
MDPCKELLSPLERQMIIITMEIPINSRLELGLELGLRVKG